MQEEIIPYMKIPGIYKITSPKGEVYIGQSVDILMTFELYDTMQECNHITDMYNSFVEHGVETHLFEIIKICRTDVLNYWERHYQELHNKHN